MYPSQPPEGSKSTPPGRDPRVSQATTSRTSQTHDTSGPQGVRPRQSRGWLIAAAIAAIIVIVLAMGYDSTSEESPVMDSGTTEPALIPESGAATGITPATDSPAITPEADAPVTTVPATDAPATDAPATDAPATGAAPATNP